jgi:hypothetical protein
MIANPLVVMAGLGPAIPTGTSGTTDGRVKPGHDEEGTPRESRS